MPDAPKFPIRLPHLFGGISNQPHHIRFPNQVEDAENFVFSVSDGASKRPGTQHLADVSSQLPGNNNSGGSSSSPPAASGTAPATCTHGDHASSYTVTWTLDGTDPDGADVDRVGETTVLAQRSGTCFWEGTDSASSNLTPWIFLQLDTSDRSWKLTFLFVPSTAQPIGLYGNTKATSGADPNNGTYGNIGVFGDSTITYQLEVKSISIA